jgi:UDP-N-acetyl-2-amino-2-deoxyglucuronate dehydrogenase
MSKILGAAVVGMGWAAGEHFKAWQNNPHTEVRAVMSRTREGAERKLAELAHEGVSISGVTVYDSYVDLASDPAIDVISITSLPGCHVEQAVDAAHAGKHLCLEKAVALNLPDLRRMQAAVRESGVKVAVCLECHYNPQVRVIKSLLDQDLIGPVYYLESDYYHGIGPWYKQWEWNVTCEQGASALLSAGLHALDLVMFFAGSEVTEVASFGCTGPNNTLNYSYDPNSVTLLKFANGAVGKCAASIEYRGPYYFPFEIHGEQGSIRDNQVYSLKIDGQKDFAAIPTIMLDSGDVTHHPYQDEIDELVTCIEEGGEHPLNLDYAAKCHEVTFAADLAAAEHRVVKMEEILGE